MSQGTIQGGSVANAVIEYVYDSGADVWYPKKGNLAAAAAVTALSATGSGTVNGSDQTNPTSKGLHLVIDITAITGTSPTLTVTLEGKDAVSGKYYTILASAALNATGTTVLRVYPGLTAAANTVANDVLPRDWRVTYTVGGTTPAVTATIAAALLA